MKTILVIIASLLAWTIMVYSQEKTLPVDKAVSAVTNKDVTATIKGKTVTFTDYSSSRYECWRFVTDGTLLIGDLWYSGGITYTPYKIIECKTLDIATNQIFSVYKLKLTDQQQESISNLVAKAAETK